LGTNTNWTALSTNLTADTNGLAVFVETNSVATHTNRFFRAFVNH